MLLRVVKRNKKQAVGLFDFHVRTLMHILFNFISEIRNEYNLIIATMCHK